MTATLPRHRAAAAAALAALALLLLGACTTPRVPSRPDTELPSRWQASLPGLPHGGDVQALADWWAGFDDPLLPALVVEAQASNPTLAQALARIEQARASLRSARSQYWPALTGRAQATRSAAAENNLAPASQASLAADAQWEIDLFGGTRATVAAAQARSEQATLAWHAARVSLAAEVAQAYVGLRSCEAQRGVFDEDATSQQQSAALTREKVRVGFESPANGALADGAAAESGNRAIAQRADCEVLLQTVGVLSGDPIDRLRTRLAARTGRLPQPAAFAVATLPAQLLTQRPDIAAAEREVVAAAAEVGVADAARFPRLSISGSLGYTALRAGGVDRDGPTWGFGPSLTLPLFDAGQRAANQDAARARYDEARAALDARLRTAVAEVEEALLRLDAATRREADAMRAAEGFRAYYAAAEQRWRVGAGSLIEREDARRIALNAQSALLAVQRERIASWVTLYRALGGGWSPSDAVPMASTK